MQSIALPQPRAARGCIGACHSNELENPDERNRAIGVQARRRASAQSAWSAVLPSPASETISVNFFTPAIFNLIDNALSIDVITLLEKIRAPSAYTLNTTLPPDVISSSTPWSAAK